MTAHEYLREARSRLEEAAILNEAGYPAGAASRLYYSVFSAARAALRSDQILTRSHSGLNTLLGRHFITTSRLASEHGRTLARLNGLRQACDYDGYDPDPAELETYLDAAERLIADVEELVSRNPL